MCKICHWSGFHVLLSYNEDLLHESDHESVDDQQSDYENQYIVFRSSSDRDNTTKK